MATSMKSYTIGYKLAGSTTEIKLFYQVLKSSFWVPFHWRSLVLFLFLSFCLISIVLLVTYPPLLASGRPLPRRLATASTCPNLRTLAL